MTADDAAIAQRMADEMRTLPPMELILRPDSVLGFVGLLQLTNRHPGLTPDSRARIAVFLTAAREYFATCPTVLHVIDLGDDAAHDRPL